MVLCRFFQQGNCRYGQNCRFEHATQQYAASTVSPLLRQTTQQASPVAVPRNVPANNLFRPAPKKDANDIYILMAQDINESEKGGVWPLSCYNFWPAISHGNVPGLEDLSPDEMRHLQLQAQAAGNIEACNLQIQQLYQQARARFNSLKIRSPETLGIIESLTRGPSQPSTQFSFAGGNNVVQDSWPTSPATQSQTSIFGGSSTSVPSQGQSSVFGGSARFSSNQASAFNSTNHFGSNQSSVFAPPNNQPSLFGGASSQASVFGGNSPQTAQTPFASNSPQSSIFGGSASVQQPLPFAAAAAVPQASPFAGAAAVPQASPFATAPSVGQSGGSIFGGASASTVPQTGSIFALSNAFGGNTNAAAASPFGVSSQQAGVATSVFGGATAQSSAQPAGNIFGGFIPSQNASSTAQAGTLVLNSTIYSTAAQLTESERKEFEAETFSVGKIPTRPPPRELC